MNRLVFGIESSCDETGVAIFDIDNNKLVDHDLYSQIALHAEFGGVVPELASRDHIRKIASLSDNLLKRNNLSFADFYAIAYTKGPGLAGALLVGAAFANAVAFSKNLKIIGINHLEGHILAPFLDSPELEYPFLALLVSGGHTMLVDVKAFGNYTVLGESLDDAAGEAFDKTAKMLSLGYPGGAKLSKLAESGEEGLFHFPRPLLGKDSLDFSFSGLKTHVLRVWQKAPNHDEATKAAIAREFENTIVDTLLEKINRALMLTRYKRVVIAGGVSANRLLRKRLLELQDTKNIAVFMPKLSFCTDNAAMIAYAGGQRAKAGLFDPQDWKINIYPRLEFTTLMGL